MSIHGTVINGTIKLPEGTHLADGTEVVITASETGSDSFADRYGKYFGLLDDGPTDLASNHDHYLYGAPKVRE